MIELAGLGEVAGTRAGGFSLGMGQRLGVAAALLGQPQTVVLDEPVNALDPDGVRWIRLLLKSLAAEGRTVFVSSHLMSEMAQTATQLIVLGRGKLISQSTVEDFTGHAAAGGVIVRTPEPARLGQVLAAPGVTVINDGTDLLRVSGTTAEQIGTAAWRFAAVFLVVPLVAAYLPQSIKGFAPYLPSNAGGDIWGAGKLFGGQQLGPWTGFAVLCAYAAVLTGLAAWRLRSRDA